MEIISIHNEPIQLDQLLKWAGIIDSGGQTKIFINEKLITINGNIITERRKKVYKDDIIELKNIGKWRVVLEK